MAYCLRDRKVENYKNLFDGPRLPRVRRQMMNSQKYYPVEILEEDKENHRLRVHYVGYSGESDEWVKEEDTVVLEPSQHGTYTAAASFLVSCIHYALVSL